MTSSLDGSVQVWAALTGQRTQIFNGHLCKCIAVQPSTPDFFLDTSEPVIRSILITQNEAVLATLSPHESPAIIPLGRDCGGVTDATFSPSGFYFVASHENGSCTVFSSAVGASVWQLIGHAGRVNSVIFAGSDSFIITCGQDKMVNFWQLPVNLSKSAPFLLHPILSLPFDLEVARIAAVGNSLVFVSVDTQTSSRLPCVCSDGSLNLGGSLSLRFDSGALKYLCSDLKAGVAGSSKNFPFSRYLLPPVWMIECIMASSHNFAKERLRCLLQGPAAGLK
jgi:WD40 repeat protein